VQVESCSGGGDGDEIELVVLLSFPQFKQKRNKSIKQNFPAITKKLFGVIKSSFLFSVTP